MVKSSAAVGLPPHPPRPGEATSQTAVLSNKTGGRGRKSAKAFHHKGTKVNTKGHKEDGKIEFKDSSSSDLSTAFFVALCDRFVPLW